MKNIDYTNCQSFGRLPGQKSKTPSQSYQSVQSTDLKKTPLLATNGSGLETEYVSQEFGIKSQQPYSLQFSLLLKCLCLELQCTEDLDGILQVLVWKIEDQITQVEFQHLYKEWLQLRQLQEVSENRMFVSIKKFESFRILVLRMTRLTQEMSKQHSQDIEWITSSQKLFELYDGNSDGLGVVSYDRMQYFLLALLLKEIDKNQEPDMPEVIARQTSMLMEHMGGPYVNQRMFREYLLSQGLRKKSNLDYLHDNTHQVMKLCAKIQGKHAVTSTESKFPQTLVETAFSHISFQDQQQLAYQIGRQKVNNLFELEPQEGLCQSYQQIRSVVSELLPKLNDSGHMQGTYLCQMPQDITQYEKQVLQAYHETNQMVLKQVIHLYLSGSQATENREQQNTTLDLTETPVVVEYRSSSPQSIEQSSIFAPQNTVEKPLSKKPKITQVVQNNQSYLTNVYINLAELSLNYPETTKQLFSVQNDGKAIMLTSKPTPGLQLLKPTLRNPQISKSQNLKSFKPTVSKKIVKSQTSELIKPTKTNKVLHSSQTMQTVGPRKQRRVESYADIMSKMYGQSVITSIQTSLQTSRANICQISTRSIHLSEQAQHLNLPEETKKPMRAHGVIQSDSNAQLKQKSGDSHAEINFSEAKQDRNPIQSLEFQTRMKKQQLNQS